MSVRLNPVRINFTDEQETETKPLTASAYGWGVTVALMSKENGRGDYSWRETAVELSFDSAEQAIGFALLLIEEVTEASIAQKAKEIVAKAEKAE